MTYFTRPSIRLGKVNVEFNKDGLMVTIGRLEKAYLPVRIFVPRESHLARLIVPDAHI